ncbi:RluA family pseudouridine synthase [Malacoplasma iowae]|uniref:Pseudouridine synthase n=1 Tax=Malacoplasma iowae 695 TaxID=1048830 RepID=A0A6P1LER8_MALIO|nr:RluA family pseudouridine synthase [Malacoplasma iowae]VEU62159.1 RNA pseudouridine synthase [Mycoplasmopsis fermentans]EGZ31483.1 pseudouridine synthase [Malacoplasma iowae 695]QHG89938.1 RluA family pseudouridine synthase [Malacoplasma iowae 695]WPL36334.1 RluA family pseudouridine synthase [Malacoplasma iowae]VEU70446.1 RNA pseudouridine synthase [Malacoplasma iowae]
MILFKIQQKYEETTLKKYLLNKYPTLTSSKAAKLIDQNKVRVNNKKSSFNYQLKIGDEIKCFFNLEPKKINYDFLNSKQSFQIVYEDKNIIIANKPKGLVCQEDANEKINTLNNQLRKYLYQKKEWIPEQNSTFIPNLCHRLDKYTNGLIIFAKNEESLKEINVLLKNNNIKKMYKCLVLGVLKNKKQTLVNYWMLDEQKKIARIDKENKYNKIMITKYEVLEEYDNFSLLNVEIVTGRKHQIRLHLSSINHPILGDTKYNKIENMGYKFPCLTSWKIEFNIPESSCLSYLNKKTFELKNVQFKK